MRPRTLPCFALLCLALVACDDEEETENPESEQSSMAYWEEQATATAVKNAKFELGCEALSTETLDRNDAIMVKWYSIGVTGCGKKVMYDVTCANRECDAERKGEILDAPGSEGAEEAEGEAEADAAEEAPAEDAATEADAAEE